MNRYDFFDPKLFTDPYALYAALRGADPVCWIEPFQGWALSRYDDCAAVMKNARHFPPGPYSWEPLPSHFPAAHGADPAASLSLQLIRHSLFASRPPAHTRARAYAAKGFTPRALDVYRAHAERVVEATLDELAERRAMDAQRDFAEVLPLRLLAECLGVPERDRARIADWMQALARFGAGLITDLETMRRLDASLVEFVAAIRAMLAERRRNPGEDMLSYLVGGDTDATLDEQELDWLVLQLFSAGHLNLVNTLAMGILSFLDHPREIERLRENAALMPNAMEELLRYLSPQQILNRHVGEDIQLRGQTLRRGDKVYVILAAANRDPQIFPDPDRFDVARANASRQIASGVGIHHCIGGKLARIIVEVAFSRLFERLPGLALAGAPVWKTESLFFRGLRALPVRW